MGLTSKEIYYKKEKQGHPFKFLVLHFGKFMIFFLNSQILKSFLCNLILDFGYFMYLICEYFDFFFFFFIWTLTRNNPFSN